MTRRTCLLAFAIALVTGCVTETNVIKADLTKRQGTYVIAFVADRDIRLQLEDQVTQALRAQNIIARASNADINDILLGKLFHAVYFSDVIIPLRPLDECLSHH